MTDAHAQPSGGRWLQIATHLLESHDARKERNIFFALLGAAALVLKGRYAGPYREAVHSYGGNIVASFAVYFVVALLPFPPRFGRLFAAGLALAVVELFEASFGYSGPPSTFASTRRSTSRSSAVSTAGRVSSAPLRPNKA